jgi:uncharacterized protein
MEFDGAPLKARANVSRHQIEFADAIGPLEDPNALKNPDSFSTEERRLPPGRELRDRVVVLSWTWTTAASIRVISARRATPKQRRHRCVLPTDHLVAAMPLRARACAASRMATNAARRRALFRATTEQLRYAAATSTNTVPARHA